MAASPQAQISVRGVQPDQRPVLTVTGSATGRHSGKLLAHPEGDGMTFIPAQRFAPGEQVDVRLQANREPAGSAGGTFTSHLRFSIARPVAQAVTGTTPGTPTRPEQVQSYRSNPHLHPPTVTVTDSNSTAPGDIFLSPKNELGQSGPLIVDNHGATVWFHPTPVSLQAFNFDEQRYEGAPVLTWWQGAVANGYGVGEDVIFDKSYRKIATVNAAEGYRADLHDFVITQHGAAWLLAYDPVREDLSAVGGPRDGVVLDCVVQELDVRTGLVLFEWHSLDGVPLDESYAKPAKHGPFDYFHINSVEIDSDGNLLVSARNTWTIYKIDRLSGKIIWRLGGKRSSFKMGPGTQFAYQHDARRQPDGTVTLFDNGAAPNVHPQSRAIALRLDMKTMRATLAQEWVHPGRLLSGSQGNMQTLPNGDRFVGWGSQPNLTEFNPQGRVVFDASLAAPATSYRAFRLAWTGTPEGRPQIATTKPSPGRVTVYASWNGATNVLRWRILAGGAPDALKPVAETKRTGFETAETIPRTAPYIAVQAEDASGRPLGTSAAISPK